MSGVFYVFVIFASLCGICGGEFKQERGKIIYVNPKYAKDVGIFTFRENRNSPYLTTLNMTTLVPVGDNVSFSFEFVNSKLQAFPIRVEMKTCDGLKTPWIREWLQTYSDVPLECPILPGKYHINKFELPPKNFPFQFNNVDYTGRSTVFLTGTKEKISEIQVELKANKKSHG